MLCVDLAAFDAPDSVVGRTDAMLARLRALPQTVAGVPVRAPGDRRRECAARRAEEGIPLRPEVAEELTRIGESAGVSFLPTGLLGRTSK